MNAVVLNVRGRWNGRRDGRHPKNGHGSWTGWSRKVVKIEIFTVIEKRLPEIKLSKLNKIGAGIDSL